MTISVNEPLLDETQLTDGNLFAMTMESLYSPPETWTQAGQQYHYVATLPIPVSGEVSSKHWSLVSVFPSLAGCIRSINELNCTNCSAWIPNPFMSAGFTLSVLCVGCHMTVNSIWWNGSLTKILLSCFVISVYDAFYKLQKGCVLKYFSL